MTNVTELPPSARPGRYGPWRLLAMQALADGQVHRGVAETPQEARRIVHRVRNAATAIGASVKSSYRPADGGRCEWFVQLTAKEGQWGQ